MLLVCSPAGVEAISLAGREEYVLGRAPDCDVCVPDGSLSRHHARLTVGAALELTDLGSKNGTTVQGARAAEGVPQRVGVGTVFELGSVTFVLQRGGAGRAVTASRPPTAPPLSEAPTLVDPTMRNLCATKDARPVPRRRRTSRPAEIVTEAVFGTPSVPRRRDLDRFGQADGRRVWLTSGRHDIDSTTLFTTLRVERERVAGESEQ